MKASQELRGHTGSVEKLGWNPTKEAELASTGTDGTLRLWDVRIGGTAVGSGKSSCVQEVKVGDVGLFLTWKPDGTEIVVGRRDDVVVPVDIRMGANGVVESLDLREGRKLQSAQTNQVCFSNSGREVFATTGEGLVKVLDWPSMVSWRYSDLLQTQDVLLTVYRSNNYIRSTHTPPRPTLLPTHRMVAALRSVEATR